MKHVKCPARAFTRFEQIMQGIQDWFNEFSEDLKHEVDLFRVGHMPGELHSMIRIAFFV